MARRFKEFPILFFSDNVITQINQELSQKEKKQMYSLLKRLAIFGVHNPTIFGNDEFNQSSNNEIEFCFNKTKYLYVKIVENDFYVIRLQRKQRKN